MTLCKCRNLKCQENFSLGACRALNSSSSPSFAFMNEWICMHIFSPTCLWRQWLLTECHHGPWAFTPAPGHKNGDNLARDNLLDLEHAQSSFPSGHRNPLSGSIRSDDVVLGQAFPPAQLSLPLSINAPQHTMPNYIWYTHTHHIHTLHTQEHTCKHTHTLMSTSTLARMHTNTLPGPIFFREGRKSRTCYISSSQNKTTTASTGTSMKHWYLGKNHIG